MKKRFLPALLALALALPCPAGAAEEGAVYSPKIEASQKAYEEVIDELATHDGYRALGETELCTVCLYYWGTPRGGYPYLYLVYKTGASLGEGTKVSLPLRDTGMLPDEPDTLAISGDGTVLTYSYMNVTGNMEVYTVDLATGETVKTSVPPTQEEIISWYLNQGGEGYATLEKRLEAPDCSVILFWSEALGKRETFVRSYSLFLIYREPEKRGPEERVRRLILPSTVYQDIYYPTDRAPEELFLNADGSVLTYVYYFDEALYDLGGKQLHDAGTYTYRVNTATGELTVEHTPLSATAEETGTGFSDVSPDDWFAPYVEVCVEAGLMEGTGEGKFEPERELTGTEAMALAYRLYCLRQGEDSTIETAPEDWNLLTMTLANGVEITGYGSIVMNAGPFSYFDGYSYVGCLTADLYYGEGVKDAVEGPATVTVNGKTYAGQASFVNVTSGLTFFPNGYPDDPEAVINYMEINQAFYQGVDPGLWWRDICYTIAQRGWNDVLPILEFDAFPSYRWEYAQVLDRAAGELESINLIEVIPDFQDDAVLRLYRAGILGGVDQVGNFNGSDTLTRAEAAAMLARVLEPELRLHLAPTPHEYSLTYLMDGEPDCGILYPICLLGEKKVMLTLDGQQLPWPADPSLVLDSYGDYCNLSYCGDYCDMGYWDESTADPYDIMAGLLDRTGAWVVPPENGRGWTHAIEGGFFTELHRGDTAVYGLLDEQGQWVRELEQIEGDPRDFYPPREQTPLKGIVPSPHGPFYVDAAGAPVSQTFDWVSPITDDGQGFVGLEGKIYRIQFTKALSTET